MLGRAALAIDILAQPMTLRRYNAGQFVNGVWQQADFTESTIAACAYSVSPDDYANLPEGIRDRATLTVWTRSELKAEDEAAQTSADLLYWRGKAYRVLMIWPRVEGGHYKAALEAVANEARAIADPTPSPWSDEFNEVFG